MKKQWNDPRLMGLGVENTKECIETTDDKGVLIHTCKWCGNVFLTHNAEIKHEKDCPHNPAHKPVNPLPGENEGPALPLS